MKNALAPNPIFTTIQGEGHLAGTTQVFLRLAGCSVGCPQCDTIFSVDSRVELDEIVHRIYREFVALDTKVEPFVWITGGEPTDHDLEPLIREFHRYNWKVGVATSGVRPMPIPVEWLSVSPHSNSMNLQQLFGNEIKLVPGLNGLDAKEFIERWGHGSLRFWFKYLQPLDGDPDSIELCKAIWRAHPDWGISIQQHKVLGLD